MNAVPNTPFLTIRDASTVTGLSQHSLRQGVRSGRYPHIRAGEKYLLNMPLLRELLDEESRKTKGNAQ